MLSLLLSLFISTSWASLQDIPKNYSTLLEKYKFNASEQAFCLKDGNDLRYSSNDRQKIKPASVTKLYVTDWALNTIGKHYRFSTEFVLSKNTLYIKGGQDPYFVTENLLVLIEELNKRNINAINEIVFDKNLFVNWQETSKEIAPLLYKYLNTQNWDKNIKAELKEIMDNNEKLGLPFKFENLSMKLKKVSYVEVLDLSSVQNVDLSLKLKSQPVYKHIKQMNVYSTNFYAQKLFDHLGGIPLFHEYMKNEYQASEEEIYFYTGSGLGENYTTCHLTLRMVEHLEDLIEQQGLKLSEVVSVAGSDLGTLRNRYKEEMYKNTIVAKTGTLRDTSSLSGFISTNSGLKIFAIFNHTFNTDGARNFQDSLVKSILGSDYDPQTLAYEQIQFSPIEDIIIE